MTSEYEKLFKMVSDMNVIKGEKCLICHFPDSNKNLVKLSCNHYFHLKCLDCKKDHTICPYCEKKSKINSLDNYCSVVIQSGNRKGEICNRLNCKYHKIKSNTCSFILKSGKRKGEICNRINCKYHN